MFLIRVTGAQKWKKMQISQIAKIFKVQTGPIMGRKIVFGEFVPKRLLMVERHFGVVKKLPP